jgi:hypothetical protein
MRLLEPARDPDPLVSVTVAKNNWLDKSKVRNWAGEVEVQEGSRERREGGGRIGREHVPGR